jgi:hypothetical protein
VTLDVPYYRCKVQPVLDNGCAQLACHGDARRAFHVFTRNRLRLDGTNTDRNQPLTERELLANFDNAAGFAAADPDASWLLNKPLDEAGGGWFHLGRELFGGDDVWLTRDDDGYTTVREWLAGATEDPACAYRGM